MKKLWLVACLISVIGVDNSWAEQEWQSTNPDPTDIERSKKEAIYSKSKSQPSFSMQSWGSKKCHSEAVGYPKTAISVEYRAYFCLLI